MAHITRYENGLKLSSRIAFDDESEFFGKPLVIAIMQQLSKRIYQIELSVVDRRDFKKAVVYSVCESSKAHVWYEITKWITSNDRAHEHFDKLIQNPLEFFPDFNVKRTVIS